jgi:superoxide reductase
VKVGQISHPMEEEHYIQWIELIADGVSYRKFLHPHDKPEVIFLIKASNISARAICNVHQLWKNI